MKRTKKEDSMKAAVLRSERDVVYQDVDITEPQAGEALVKVHLTGICGSDIPRVNNGAVHFFPIVLGHEFSGEIVRVGEGVDEALVGRRVAGIPLQPCMECDDCKAGNFSLFANYKFVGSRLQGSMAQYVTLPLKNLFFLGDDVSDFEGALFEPAAVAVHGIELTHFEPGKTAIVVGCGTIGILCAQALWGYGASNVVVTNISDALLDIARAAGLKNLVNSSEEDWMDKAHGLNGGKAFDYVYDTAGVGPTIIDSLNIAGKKSTVMFIGTPKKPITLSVRQWENINRKELTVMGSWMSYSAPWPGREWEIINDFFGRGIMKVVPNMLDKVYNLADTDKAFARFRGEGEPVLGKILIDSWEEQ